MKRTPLVIDVTAGKESNYQISVQLDVDQKKAYRQKVLLDYQKEATKPGFRKGKVPLEMVEEMVNPGSVVMAVLEEIMNDALRHVIDTHSDKKWIGQAYGLDTNDYKDDTTGDKISFYLDVFPEVTQKDEKRKKLTPKAYDVNVTDTDIDATLDQLRSNYAQFDDVEVVDTNSLMRLKFSFFDADKAQLGHTKNQYLGKEELDQHPKIQAEFIGKKKGDSVTLDYKKASVISLLSYSGEGKPKTVSCEIVDIKVKILPELDQVFIDKTFTKDDGIASVDELRAKVKETLVENKNKNALFEWVDDYLKDAMKSFELALPQTFIDQEVKHRLDHMGEQLGGEKGLKAYFERMGEKESKAYLDTVKDSAITSMQKYFILKQIADDFELGIDREKNPAEGEVEQKLYVKLVK